MLCAGETPNVYYVDCGRAVSGDGHSPESPWNDLQVVNARDFLPGDTIELRRGSECHGTLTPRGSGDKDHAIRMTAYGNGARPRIIAPQSAESVLRLFNQEYWDIDSLDLSGSHTFGILISGDRGVLHHIHLKNLAVHDVLGEGMKHKESGLVVVAPGAVSQHFDDVVIDGVMAWNTRQWAGILVGGGNFGFPPPESWNTRVTIRNSVVHDVQGDGIVLFRVRQGSITSSVAWNTGMQITESMGTPNAIWTWMCDQCTVARNEAFLTDSPGVDGGAFDIDYGNTGNSVIENYGHDTQGYCVAVFGAGFVTRQSTIRGNLCINNGRSPRMADFQGAIFLHTWNGGSIDGLTVEKNTVEWNPYEATPALIDDADVRGSAMILRDNTIDSTSPKFVDSKAGLTAEQNHYRYFGHGTPQWRFGNSYADLTVTQQAGQETGSELSTHTLSQWGQRTTSSLRRFDGESLFGGGWLSLTGTPHVWPTTGHWHLYAKMPGVMTSDGLASDESMQQLVNLRSLAAQYGASGLKVTLMFSAAGAELSDLINDMHLQGFDIAVNHDDATAPAIRTVLVSPHGDIAGEWQYPTGPVPLGHALRLALGEPIFSQMEAGW